MKRTLNSSSTVYHTRRRAPANVESGILARRRGQVFFEPVMSVVLSVKGSHFNVSGSSIESDRFGQVTIGLEPEDSNARFTGVPFQLT